MTAFFDTNIVVYAVTDDPKSDIARVVLSRGGVISVQVLNELTNVLSKKYKRSWSDIDRVVQAVNLMFPDPVPITKSTHSVALDIAREHQVSFYDALIVASAIETKCGVLFTEDLQHDRRFGSLLIVDPFRSS